MNPYEKEYILYLFATCMLRAFIPLLAGVFLIFYRKPFGPNAFVSGVFIPIGLLYFFDSFSQMPYIEPCNVYDVRAYLVFICLPPFARFYANCVLNIKNSLTKSLVNFIPCIVMLALYLLLKSFRPHIPFCYSINDIFGYFSDYPLYVVYFLLLMAFFTFEVYFYSAPVARRLLQIRTLQKKYGYPTKEINQFLVVTLSFVTYSFVFMFFFAYYNNLAVFVIHNLTLPVFVSVITLLIMNKHIPIKQDFEPKLADDVALIGHFSDAGNNEPLPDNSLLLINQFAFLFEKNEWYKRSDLTLEMIAKKINTNRNHLLALISKHYGCSFKQLYVKYRMEEAKRLLADKDFDIQQIAFEIGYNSRSAFYVAFRENVSDLPPLKWRKQQQEVSPKNE